MAKLASKLEAFNKKIFFTNFAHLYVIVNLGEPKLYKAYFFKKAFI